MRELADVPPTRSRNRRWLVPLLVLLIAFGGFTVPPRLSATEKQVDLPPITPADLITKVQASAIEGLSGTVETNANLGIPDLGPQYATSPGALTFLTGEHRAHVWLARSGDFKLQIPDAYAETDVVRSGQNLWAWRSQGQEVVHTVLPPRDNSAAKTLRPNEIALEFINAPTSESKILATTNIAGRNVYVLGLNPKSSTTLFGAVLLWIDAENFTPLRLQAYAKSEDKPSFEVGYTEVSYGKQDASTFEFTPPEGAKVETETVTQSNHGQATITGSAWDAVIISPKPDESMAKDEDDDEPNALDALLKSAKPVQGAFGSGKLIHTKLFNVVVLDDGRIAAGSVNEATLLAAIPRSAG